MPTENHNIELGKLLEFINLCPFGLVKAQSNGQILLLNGVGSQLLIPVSMESDLDMSNILDIIEYFDPSFRHEIEHYPADFGRICSNRRLKVQFKGHAHIQYLSFTISRLNEEIFQYAFKDVSDIIENEVRMKEIAESTALQAGKLEMASGILHDIGNAVTAFGADVAKLSGDLDWRELTDLGKLIQLFETRKSQLDEAMGVGKGEALLKFISALRESLTHRQADYQDITQQMADTTSHVQDILNIQRHYVKGKTRGVRAPIELRHVIDDALAMQERGIEKRGIFISKNLPIDLPPIKGDKTKLIQVLVNIFKNAGETFDEVEEKGEKRLEINLTQDEASTQLVLTVKDNAIGFAPEQGETFFQKGITSKNMGSGFGLHNCRQIVETHQGSISMHSEGAGKGATVIMTLPYELEEMPSTVEWKS
ncbi:MAG: ATP-binding protein [Bacteroidota bacterium]